MRLSFHPVPQARARSLESPEEFEREFSEGGFLLVDAEFFRPRFRSQSATIETMEGEPILSMESDGVLVRVPAEASVAQPFRVGRHDDNELPLRARNISGHHFRCWLNGQELTVVDLDSRNGTSLRGEAFPPGVEKRVKHGQTMRVGSVAVGYLSGARLREWLLIGARE